MKEPTRAEDGKFHHGCGQSFQHAAWYTKHALKCDGKPVQTRGRIERLAARRNGHAKPDRQQRARTVHGDRTPPEPDRAQLIDAKQVLLVELRTKRDLLNAAIAGLEALA